MKNTFIVLLFLASIAFADFVVTTTDTTITNTPIANPDGAVLWLDGSTYKIRVPSGFDIALAGNATGGHLGDDYSGLDAYAMTVNVDDLAQPTSGGGYRITATGARQLSGIAGGVDNQILLLFVVGTGDVRLLPLNAGSSVGNRIATPDGANFDIRPNGSIYIRYDITLDGGNGAWHVMAHKN